MPQFSPLGVYYYYYATQVMFHGAPEAVWKSWNDRMRDLLIDTQDQGGNPERRHQAGSWAPDGELFGPQLGRLGVTSLSLLTLEVYYRRLPLYRRQLGAMKEEQVLRR